MIRRLEAGKFPIDSKQCTAARHAHELELPSHQRDALLHPEQPHRRASAGALARGADVETDSVVANGQLDPVEEDLEVEPDAPGSGMPSDVRERLLRDAEAGRLELRLGFWISLQINESPALVVVRSWSVWSKLHRFGKLLQCTLEVKLICEGDTEI